MKPSEHIADLRAKLAAQPDHEDAADWQGELDMFLRGDLPDWVIDEPEAFDPETGCFIGMTEAEMTRYLDNLTSPLED